MENYLLSILGIAVSIMLFLIGYRQTIGAKKERIKSANSEVEKIMVRRIVLESYTAKPIDIARLIEGKARDFRVKVGDLLSDSQIMNCIYTRIVETDLIAHNQREEILSRIIPVLEEAEATPFQEKNVVEVSTESRRKTLYQIAVPLTMGIVASLMGALVTVIPKIGTIDMDIQSLFPILIATASVSLALIISYYTFSRLKESQQEVTISSSSRAIEQAINFERDVARVIEKTGLKILPAGPSDRGYDFAIEKDGKRIFVEVKAWSRTMPIRILSRVVEVLEKTVNMENAAEGFVITKSPIDFKSLDLENKKIQIMTLSEFRNYLAHRYK
jgi:hypothetical protein